MRLGGVHGQWVAAGVEQSSGQVGEADLLGSGDQHPAFVRRLQDLLDEDVGHGVGGDGLHQPVLNLDLVGVERHGCWVRRELVPLAGLDERGVQVAVLDDRLLLALGEVVLEPVECGVLDSNTRRDTCCFVQASTTLRVAVVTAPRRFLGSSEGPTLDASTAASTSARASVSPSPGTRSIPRDLDTSTTSTSRALRRCTTREPAVPVAPMTAIFMSFRSSFSRTPKRATSRDVSPETADQASGGEAPRRSGRGQAGERSSDRRRAPAWSTLRVQSGPYMSRFSVGT